MLCLPQKSNISCCPEAAPLPLIIAHLHPPNNKYPPNPLWCCIVGCDYEGSGGGGGGEEEGCCYEEGLTALRLLDP